ncbi:latrophilin Cirl [Ochlerotatus camptorhynchus]|uniref:latrophilin Cirl n=1 Tax=Ochlerotatus camptorhynchus TaxID=644619 RepID=UPI0031DF40D1
MRSFRSGTMADSNGGSSSGRRRRGFRAPEASCSNWRSVWSSVALLLMTLPTLNFAIAPKYETAYACEGKTLMIECENGDLINLIRANYGRFSITICNDHGNVDWSVNCMSPKSLRVLHSKCAQKQNCSVLASTNMFGDPCQGTHKYLEAHYQCVSAAQSSTTTNRPSPPWLKTSQPIVWSTSTVRNPVLSKLNFSDPLAGFGVTSATSSSIGMTVGKVKPTTPYKQQTLMVNQQSPPSFGYKGFENKSVNDDLAIIKTISGGDAGKRPKSEDKSGAGAPEDDEDFGDDEDYFPTQTAVLSNANRDRDRSSSDGSKSYDESNVSMGGNLPSSKKNDDNHSSSSSGSNSNSISGNSNSSIGNSAVNNNVLDVSHACGPTTARNLFWNVTRVGESNVQPCPGGATGIAKWRCVAIGSLTPEQRMHLQQQSLLDDNNKSDISFNSNLSSGSRNGVAAASGGGAMATWYSYQPDLTQCRSLWLNNLEIRVNQQDSSLISIANDLSQVTSSKTLYGGDMLVATKIMQTMSQKMHFDIETLPDQRQREALVYELLNSVVKTGSNLLDQSQHASWLDLSVEDQMRVATSLLTGLEDNAFLLADTILRERHVVQKVKNILLSIRVLETRNFVKNEVFPDSSQERWQVSNDQIELPKAALIENSEGGLVRIVFVAFDRLEQILRPQFTNIQQPRVDQNKLEQDDSSSNNNDVSATTPRQRLLNSKVISASLGKGRHIQLSQPIRMILKHLRTKNVSNPTCVFWNYIDHAWSEDGCYVEYTNATHTVCMCNHLTNFALLIDAIDETQLSLLSIIDDDIKILIYISIAICIVIVIIALFALKLFNGVFSKVRRRNHQMANNAAADLHLPNHLQHHGLIGAGADLDVNIHPHQHPYNSSAAGMMPGDGGHIMRAGTGHNHHNNNNLVTTTFNNLGPVAGGPGLGGYETAPHHRLAAQERINNNQISSRSKLLLLPYKPHHQHL